MRSTTELAMTSGADREAIRQWATAQCPDGVDPQVWADAQRTRVARARRWDERALGRLPHYMAGVLTHSKTEPVSVETDQAA